MNSQNRPSILPVAFVSILLGGAVSCSSNDAGKKGNTAVKADASQTAADAAVTMSDAAVITPDAAVTTPDAAVTTSDAAVITSDAAVIPSGHLLLSEIMVTPTTNEFIEIHNPTSVAISLENYFLSDDDDYSLLPGGTGSGPAPVINTADFIVQFPAGAMILADETLTVALDADGFFAAFAVQPTFSVSGVGNSTATQMIQTNVGASPSITNKGESIHLFFWDGVSDLVADLDIMQVGDPSVSNAIFDKAFHSVDGPDADTETSTYLVDSISMPRQGAAPRNDGVSTKRIAAEGDNEVTSGGNGISGHDETSENTALTWDSNDTYSAPTPNVSDIQ